MTRRQNRIARAAGGVVVALICLLALAMILASHLLQGKAFGRLVERHLPRTRGAIHVGGGNWTWGALWDLWRGRPAGLSFDDVQLLDPEGTEVFHAAHLVGRLKVDRPSRRVVVSELRVQGATWRFARMRAHADVGFLAALSPAAAPNPIAATTKVAREPETRATSDGRGGAGSFQIVDARIEGLDAVFVFPQWDLSLRDVWVSGQLTFDAASGARPAFVFAASGADVRGGGRLGALGSPHRRELSFQRATLNRVATTADMPQAIFLDVSSVAAGRSMLAFTGSFDGVYGNGGRAPPAGMNAIIKAQHAADAIQAILSSGGAVSPAPPVSVSGGPVTSLSLTLAGRFSALSVTADALGFDIHGDAFDLRDMGFHFSGLPAAGHMNLSHLTFASPQGGRLRADAEIDGVQAVARLTFADFAPAGLVPRFLRPLVAGTLDGTIAAKADLGQGRVWLDQLALSLSRPPGAAGPRVLRMRLPSHRIRPAFAEGTVVLPSITASAWGGRVTAGGTIVLNGTPGLDASIDARGISVERMAGTGFVTGMLSFHARAQGTPQDLSVQVRLAPQSTLRLFGERFRLPHAQSFHLNTDGVSISGLNLQGAHGGTLSIGGQVALDGTLNLVAGIYAFPFAKLPAFADTQLPLGGRLDGRLKVFLAGGDQESFSATGRLSVHDATFQGRPIGDGALDLTPDTHGAFRAKGQIVDGVIVDGVLRAGQQGLAGDAHVWLRDVRLQPFIGPLAGGGGATATGLISGTATARLAPGTPALIEGRLTKVDLAVTGPGVPTRAITGDVPADARLTVPEINLRAAHDMVIFAQAGGGPKRGAIVRIEPTQFIGNAASIQVAGESNDGRTRATVRGMLNLTVLSDLAHDIWRIPWLDRLTGNANIALSAVTTPEDAWPLVTGKVRASAEVALRAGGAAFKLRIPDGHLDLRPDRSATLDVPMALAGRTLHINGGWTQADRGTTRLALDARGELDAGLLQVWASSADLRSATGLVRLTAHLGGTLEHPAFDSRIDVGPGGIALALPSLGNDPVRIIAGRIDADERSALCRDVTIQLGGHGRVIIGDVTDGPARLGFAPFQPPSLIRVDVPLRGELTHVAVRTAVVDDARFALRLRGQGGREGEGKGEAEGKNEVKGDQLFHLSLSGAIDVVKARVNGKAVPPSDASAATRTSTLLKRRELQDLQLDLRVRSQRAAVTVEVPYVPDVGVDVDYQVRGTPEHPRLSGGVRSSGIYNRAALSLYRLFH